MLEIRGEMPFKVGAYRRAADSMANSPIDIAAAYRRGRRRNWRASARPSTRSWPNSRTRAGCASTSGSGATFRLPRLATGRAGLGPRTAGDLWRAAGHRHVRRSRGGRQRSAAHRPRHQREDRGRILDGLEELRKRPPGACGWVSGGDRRPGRAAAGRRGRPLVVVRRFLPPPARNDRRPGLARRDRQSSRGYRPIASAPPGGARRAATAAGRVALRARPSSCAGPQLDVMTMPPGRPAHISFTSPARRSTTCGCVRSRATAAGA